MPVRISVIPTALRALPLAGAAALLSACAGSAPQLGGAPTVATGSAAGASAANANAQLERCERTLGTLAVVEDQRAP